MRLAHLFSPGTSDIIGLHSTMVSVHPDVWTRSPQYRESIKKMSQKGTYTYMLAESPAPGDITFGVDPSSIDEMAVPIYSDDDFTEFVRRAQVLPKGVGLSVLLVAGDEEDLREQYNSVRDIEAEVNITSVAIPVAPVGYMEDRDVDHGFIRAEFIQRLVDNGEFLPHLQHHLYGMVNPVEMVLYQREFGGFVRSAIRSASSAALYLSALYGMQFSEQSGFYYLPPSRSVEYFGTTPPQDVFLSDRFGQDQMRVLRTNSQIISGFSSGRGGDSVLDEYRAMRAIEI